MKEASADSHEFCRKDVPRDHKCLFWSFLFAKMPYFQEIFGKIQFNKDLLVVLNEALRAQVADYIRQRPELQTDILQTFNEYKTMGKYYSDLEQGVLWGGQPELKALSNLYKTIICVINPIIKNKEYCLKPLYYQPDESSGLKCIYILHDRDHYEPLYLINKKNGNEIETNFDPDDPSVNNILKKFIKDKIDRNGDIELGLTMRDNMKKTHKGGINLNTTNSTLSPFCTDRPNKRRESTHDDIVISSNNDEQLAISDLVEPYNPNKRVKIGHDTPDENSPFYRESAESTAIGQIIQSNSIPAGQNAENVSMDLQQTTDPPVVLNNHYDEMNEVDSESNDNSQSNQ